MVFTLCESRGCERTTLAKDKTNQITRIIMDRGSALQNRVGFYLEVVLGREVHFT